jgi:hypothetical protein
MAGIKISDMNADTSVSGVELIPVSDAGVTKSVTVTALKQFVIDSIEALAAGTTTTTADSLFYLQGGVMKSVEIDIIVQYAVDTIWAGTAATVPADADKIPLLQTATGKTLTLTLLAEYVRGKIAAAILDASGLGTAGALVDADYFHVTQSAVGKKVAFSTIVTAIYAGLTAWITALDAVTSPSSADVFLLVRSGVSKKITWANLLAVVGNTFAPATTTENYIPQWASAQKTLKDGLLLRTAVRTAASADNVSLPTELAVRTAVDAMTTFTGGSAGGAVAMRFGATATEGLTTMVVDKTVTLGAVAGVAIFTIPSGAVLRSIQGNIQVAAVAGGTTAIVGIGVDSDPNLYAQTANLNKNSKAETAMAPTLLASPVALEAFPCTSGGAIGDTQFSAGTLRVRIVYDVLVSLDNA